MKRSATFARGSTLPAVTLNRIQDQADGFMPATGAPSGSLALLGHDGRYWSTPDAGVTNATIAVVDTSRDWRAHHVTATFVRLGAAAQRLHGADAWKRNDPAQAFAVRRVEDAFTGANVAAITAGVAPVIGAGVFAIILDELGAGANRVFLYARTGDGALCLYNDSGGDLHGELFFDGTSAAASSHGAPTVPGLLTGDVATSDATWTTIVTLSPGTSSSVVLTGNVAAITSDGGDGGGWAFAVRVRRGAAGNPAVGTPFFALAAHDGTGWDVRVQASDAAVVVQVLGQAATDITWRAEVTATEARIS